MRAASPHNRLFIAYLIVCSLAGMAAIYAATWRYGAGVSTDAVMNLAAATNLMHGRGLLDLYFHPLVQWPPLYALLLAALSLLTRADVFLIGWHLNALVFAACIFCAGLLFRDAFPAEPLFAYIGAAVVATCLGIIQISANIASDPPLLLLAILFLLFAARYGRERRTRDLIGMGIFACLGSFQRYAGLALVAAGAGGLVWMYRRQLVAGLVRGAAFFVVTGAPIFAWGIFHNLPLTGQLFGSYLQADVWGNLVATTEKLLYWFIPFSLIERLTTFGILAALLLALLLLNRAAHWKSWWQLITSDGQIASTIFFVLYAGMLVFYVSYREHRNLESQRIHMVILPSLLMLMFSTLQELVPPRAGASALPRKQQVLALLTVLWLIYPLAKVWDYERKSAGVESSGTNLYNTRLIHAGTFIQDMQALPVQGKAIYSNYEAPAWFYLRAGIGSIPRVNPADELDSAGLAQFQASTAANGESYLLWFNTVHIRDNLPSPEQLGQVVQLEPLLLSDAGNIYRIVPRSP